MRVRPCARVHVCVRARVCRLVSNFRNVCLCNCTAAEGVPGGQQRKHESATAGLQAAHQRKQLQIGGRRSGHEGPLLWFEALTDADSSSWRRGAQRSEVRRRLRAVCSIKPFFLTLCCHQALHNKHTSRARSGAPEAVTKSVQTRFTHYTPGSTRDASGSLAPQPRLQRLTPQLPTMRTLAHLATVQETGC